MWSAVGLPLRARGSATGTTCSLRKRPERFSLNCLTRLAHAGLPRLPFLAAFALPEKRCFAALQECLNPRQSGQGRLKGWRA